MSKIKGKRCFAAIGLPSLRSLVYILGEFLLIYFFVVAGAVVEMKGDEMTR